MFVPVCPRESGSGLATGRKKSAAEVKCRIEEDCAHDNKVRACTLLIKSYNEKPVSIAGYQEAVRNQGDTLLPGKWLPQDEAFDNPEREQRNRSGGHLHQPL